MRRFTRISGGFSDGTGREFMFLNYEGAEVGGMDERGGVARYLDWMFCG
jgi:hypothetical protein